MENENEHRSKNKKSHYYHHKKNNKSNTNSNNVNGANNTNSSSNTNNRAGRQETANTSGASNKTNTRGGYSSANQMGGRSGNGTQRDKRDVHSRDNYNNNRRDSRPRDNGYQPDTDKQAIRKFILGTFEQETKNYVFSFDCGNYRIVEKEGTEENIQEKELLNSKDKLGAYQSWNEIKRPKKGRGRQERKEENGKQRD